MAEIKSKMRFIPKYNEWHLMKNNAAEDRLFQFAHCSNVELLLESKDKTIDHVGTLVWIPDNLEKKESFWDWLSRIF